MLPDRFPSIPPNQFQKYHVLKVWLLDKQQMMPIFPPLISATGPILSSSNFAKKLLKVPICSVSVLVCNSVLALIQFRFIFDLYQIPFRFSYNFRFDLLRFSILWLLKCFLIFRQAMEQFSSHSCVKWRPHLPTDMDYVHILRDSGCYSRVGRTGRAQVLSLGKLFVFYPQNQSKNKEI